MHRVMIGSIWVILCVGFAASIHAQAIPLQVNYQGQVSVNGIPFDGVGQFKFSLVDDPVAPTTNYWTNDGSSPAAGGEPTDPVSITVSGGKYSIQLGDAGITNMTAIPVTAFNQPGVYLRIWFNDGSTGFQRLSPDRQLTSAPYAYVAETVSDGAITSEKIALESLLPEHSGRSDTVVSYLGQHNGAPTSPPMTVTTVPADKNLIITDVVIHVDKRQTDGTPGGGEFRLFYEIAAVPTNLLVGYYDAGYLSGSYQQPFVFNFRSGLVVPPSAVIKFDNPGGTGVGSIYVTISGYESVTSSVVTEHAVLSGLQEALVLTVPAGKTFVLTDIVIQSASASSTKRSTIFYVKDTVTTLLWRGHWSNFLPNVITFRSGLPVPAGAELRIEQSDGITTWILSGYEIDESP